MMKWTLLLFFLLPQYLFAQTGNSFVTTKGHRFLLNGKPYYYIGTNYWYGGLLALQKEYGRGKQRLIKELDFLHARGVNNLRVLVGAEGSGIINGVNRVAPPLQPEKGKFNDDVLNSLDFLLLEMGKRNMKAVLYLSNNWEWSGGFLQYLNWNGLLPDTTLQRKPSWDELRDQVSQFYSCTACKRDYENQVRYILSHSNSYTGIKYVNDPAIMSWEIANEPRPMRPSAIPDYKQWIASVSALIKNLDKNHLVTIGTEGSIGTEQQESIYSAVHAPEEIDYLTIHIWPKNWAWFSDTAITQSLPVIFKQTQDYINQHERIAEVLKKPLVIEEFGLPRDHVQFSPSGSTHARDQYYRFIFNQQRRSYLKMGSIAGVNFWAFAGTARPVPGQLFWKEGDDYMGDPPQEEQGLNVVFDGDNSTWSVIREYARKLNSK